jgi:hypothetical protein
MKLIWHIIKKDALRDRWALVLWALLFVGQISLGLVMLRTGESHLERVTYGQLAGVALVFLQITMGYVLVARLVQSDALVGTVMFWRTRPVSAARLLVAKALGALVLFGFLPVLLLLPWWLYCEFGWREIFWTAVDTLGWQLLMIAPAFLVASLTDDLGRVLLWTLLLVIGVFSWIILLFGATLSKADLVSAAIIYTKLWVSAAVFVAGGTAIAAHQYLTRRFVRSVVLVAFGLGLIALIGQVWPWNWAKVISELHRPALPPAAAGLLENLVFTVEPADGVIGQNPRSKQDLNLKEAALYPRVLVTGLPQGMTIAAERVKQTWSWADGLQLSRDGYYEPGYSPVSLVLSRVYALPLPPADPETVKWEKDQQEKKDAERSARGVRPYRPNPPEPDLGGALLHGYSTLPNSFLAKMRAESPAYRAEAQWILFRPELVVELPLKEDVRASNLSRTFRSRSLQGDTPLLVTTRASVSQDGLWQSAAVAVPEFRRWLFSEHAMSVNHTTGDIVWVGTDQAGSRLLTVGGVSINWNVLYVDPRWPMGGRRSAVAGAHDARVADGQ